VYTTFLGGLSDGLRGCGLETSSIARAMSRVLDLGPHEPRLDVVALFSVNGIARAPGLSRSA
jgi:hypothetical protein